MAQKDMTQVYYSEARSSTAHRYGRKDWDEAKNRSVYGEQYSNDGLGHNFEVRLGLVGDAQMSGAGRLAQMIDHKFLDKDVEFFKSCPSTLEMITSFLFHEASIMWGRMVLDLEVKEGADLTCRIQNGWLSLRKAIRSRGSTKVYDVSFTVAGEVDPQSGLLIIRNSLAQKIAGALDAVPADELAAIGSAKESPDKWNLLARSFEPQILKAVVVRDALNDKVLSELQA